MNVFISWSGGLSKAVAEILRDWIKCTLQASEPWISSQDIDKGSLWFNEINDSLKDTKIGIVCLTAENKDRPWILFETGALARGISSNRVCTFLINLKPSDLDNPLAQFNHTQPTKEDLKKLLASINSELGDRSLKERILEQVFETYWPQFETQIDNILSSTPQAEVTKPPREESDILEELLTTVRSMDRRMRKLEQKEATGAITKALNMERKAISNILAARESSEQQEVEEPNFFSIPQKGQLTITELLAKQKTEEGNSQ